MLAQPLMGIPPTVMGILRRTEVISLQLRLSAVKIYIEDQMMFRGVDEAFNSC